ncbi:PLP-dependent enzyme, histidinol-phosphate/aromatic aminotransferase or cobyric acid decarboxylase [Rivularia sp. PCC 7116]|uniref:histidinol-phosphate transaminase n=1 Tax=Rivularia sp. PCC 7116 TaxID=373994 RepID=UPI00029ED90F|nr:histidinol-phosphate transaminase [Rivularia sp. PCC 7116]AFY53165.1 PLP-dependent enzyme, histidinol-phosphate/aromatic aminotransferase or cobyric acid decarboxylase [Rivularia sp. PCC 7116]
MLPFLRNDLVELAAYKPQLGIGVASQISPAPTQSDKLDTNESPYDLPIALKEKLAWTYKELIKTNRYPDGGHSLLKQAISEYINESANLSSNVFVSNNISLGNGSDELIRSILISTCLGGNGSVLVAQPTFSMYGILAQALGIPVVSVPRNSENFEIDLQAASEAIAKTQKPPIRTVFVVHPNSPTANCLTTAELEWLRSLPQDILVVIDEAYFEFSQNTLASELSQHPNWIILRTFSKGFRLAAMRVGYSISHPEVTAILEKVRLPYNLPSFSIAAALIAIQNRSLLLECVSQTNNERLKLIKNLSQYSEFEIFESAANFVFLRLKTQLGEEKNTALTNLHKELKSSGTLIRLTGGGLRITVGSPSENVRTLERFQKAYNNLEL